MKGKQMFSTLMCIKGGVVNGKEFLPGEIYPVCGSNNGVNLVYENENSDATTLLLCSIGGDKYDAYHCPFEEESIQFI